MTKAKELTAENAELAETCSEAQRERSKPQVRTMLRLQLSGLHGNRGHLSEISSKHPS